MTCSVCGRVLIPSIHWCLREMRPIALSIMMVNDITMPDEERNTPITLCHGCASDLGIAYKGDNLPQNRTAFKHPSIWVKRPSDVQTAQVRAAVSEPLYSLVGHLNDLEERTRGGAIDPLIRLEIACARSAVAQMMHVLGEFFPKEQADVPLP